uniref:ribosomal protein L24 n=1 Tax=Rhodella violacea TaxID=2801 RepID=UPI001FCDC13B|nr:ribosomal protein L24 [Rhodella violacea]UNJ18032.1 ribosomal protein L24 [Rhodella violacea]
MVSLKLNKHSHKFHIRKGDIVKIISGNDKGKIGEVIELIKPKEQVIVKGINIKIKHKKSNREGELGQINQIEYPIHSSNVMLFDKENNIASRVGFMIDSDGTKKRKLKKLL